ncbi:DUF503 domain-containing protein [Thermovirga sp.]|uniref:DUF503 domain-containing protein n=1 Tax=Thermococcus litoralis TaxID=2265 RepID=A0A7C5K193_THELI|nr:DUF503 domain-containing protein [Thermovirga sp.]MBO8153497.1 DUF503 domain-containing protein [Thermovirga sp.]HHI00893.1 DUF503 domain-containing protein [Thermococcus litoralis]
MFKRCESPVVGLLILEIKIHGAKSLKDRRQVVRSLVTILRRRWNVSVSDLGPLDSWSDAIMAIGVIGSSFDSVEDLLSEVSQFLTIKEDLAEFSIVRMKREVEKHDIF